MIVIKELERKAKKKYKCHLCGFSIKRGHKYFGRIIENDYGEIISMKYHEVCGDCATNFFNNEDWEEWDRDYKWFRKTYGITLTLINSDEWKNGDKYGTE